METDKTSEGREREREINIERVGGLRMLTTPITHAPISCLFAHCAGRPLVLSKATRGCMAPWCFAAMELLLSIP